MDTRVALNTLPILTIHQVKCEGSANPPCIRCRKSGRPCLPPPTNPGSQTTLPDPRQHYQSPPSIPRLHEAIRPQSHGLPRYSNGFTAISSHSTNDSLHKLPSIYSTAPVDAVIEPGSKSPVAISPYSTYSMAGRKRKRPGLGSGEGLMTSETSRTEEIPISKKDMKDMVLL